MKKLFAILFMFVFISTTFALQVPGDDNLILNENPFQALDVAGINDPIRDGAYKAIDSDATTKWIWELWWIIWVNNKIDNHQTAKNQTLSIVKSIINYALGLVSLVALVYMIYHGVLILTAWGEETQYKKWLKWIQFAAIALIGIWASRLIISFIFWIINLIIK